MIFMPFGEWAPDKPALTTGVVKAENLLPISDGYESGPSFVKDDYFDAVLDDPLRIMTLRDGVGDSTGFAFTRTNIYVAGADGAWTDITRATGGDYATVANGDWSVIPWGNSFYAVNGLDKIQKYVFGSPNCVDVNGVTTDFVTGKYSTIVKDFHVLADIKNGTALYPFRVWWSGRLRPELFDPSLATMAGWRDHNDIGTIQGITGGDYGVLYGSDGIARFDFYGPPGVFEFANIDLENGCMAPKSIIRLGSISFWLSSRGFRGYSGGGPVSPIGTEKVDRFFLGHANLDKLNLMSVSSLKNRPIVMWLYVSQNSVDGLPDEILFYNYRLGRFSSGKIVGLTLLGDSVIGPDFLDDARGNDLIDVDNPDELIDQNEGIPFIAGLDRNNNVLRVNDFTNPGTIVTSELGDMKTTVRTRIVRARLISDGRIGKYYVTVNSRDYQSDTFTTSPRLVPEPTGSVAINKRGRYNRLTIELEDGFSRLLGIEVEVTEGGIR